MSYTEKIYSSSPLWMQHLMISFKGWQFNHQRFDQKTIKTMTAFLMQSQWWDDDQYTQYQVQKLKQLIRFARNTIPYYRNRFSDLGITEDTVESLADISKIPILDKETVRNDPLNFVVNGNVDPRWVKGFTSGTTGSPLSLFWSTSSFSTIWAFVFRLRLWAGVHPFRPRRVQFTGRDIIPGSINETKVFWRNNYAGNALLMSTTHIEEKTIARYVAAINKFKPELIDGYPSAIKLIAQLSAAKKIALFQPKAIIVSAETLFEEDRLLIERQFGCKVFNQYASSDTSSFICSCEQGKLHLNPEFGICEMLDSNGQPAGAMDSSEIVSTAFHNREQVFIRYKVGDVGIPGECVPCSCGRKMPVISAIEGRMDDVLYTEERGYIGRLDPVFKGVSGIIEAQIIQEKINFVRVLVVKNESGFDPEGFKLNLRKKLGSKINIEIEETTRIQRGRNGKFRSVIRKCKIDTE